MFDIKLFMVESKKQEFKLMFFLVLFKKNNSCSEN